MTTMTTVGYGDLSPNTEIQVISVIVSLLVLCGVFAYSFNLIGVIIQEMNKRNEKFKYDISLANYYMDKININSEIKY